MTESSADDTLTIQRVHAGEKDAFATLVRKYEVRVRGYCMTTLRDAALGEDAAQEIFLKAYQGLKAFHGDSAFSSWLYRITVNHCRDVLRKASRRKSESWDAMLEREGETAEARLTGSADASERFEHAETLRRVLAELPESHREILLLRESQGLNYEELASILGCSLDAVKSRLKRARQEILSRSRHFLLQEDV